MLDNDYKKVPEHIKNYVNLNIFFEYFYGVIIMILYCLELNISISKPAFIKLGFKNTGTRKLYCYSSNLNLLCLI